MCVGVVYFSRKRESRGVEGIKVGIGVEDES